MMVYSSKSLFIIILSVILFLGLPIESLAQENNKEGRPDTSNTLKLKTQKDNKNNEKRKTKKGNKGEKNTPKNVEENPQVEENQNNDINTQGPDTSNPAKNNNTNPQNNKQGKGKGNNNKPDGDATSDKTNEKRATQALQAVNNEGGDEFNGSVLNPSEDEINILMNTLLNVMKKGNLSDVKVILKSIYNSTSTYSVPKEAISIQKKRIKKKDRTYLVVNIFNLKTTSGATIPPSSLPTDTYELIFETEGGEYSTNPVKYFTPTLIVGTVKSKTQSKTQGLVTIEGLDGTPLSEKTVVVNPNGTFFTEVRANKLLSGTKIRKNKTRISASVRNQETEDTQENEEEITSEVSKNENPQEVTTGIIRVVTGKDLLAITQLKNDPKLNAKKSEKTIVVDDVSTITANIAKSSDKALAQKIAEEQIKELESEKEKQFGDDIGCEIDKFAQDCISSDEGTLTEIGANFRDFVKNNTCNFPEYGLIREFILASPEDINFFIGQGYCEFFKGEANDDKPCEAYTDILNDFKEGLISELPCPPPFCEEFQNIRPPKCVESQEFCEDDGSSVDPNPEPFLFKLERVCRGPECIEETNECIHKVEKDHFCQIIGEEVDFEECEGDPNWQIAYDIENVGYCIPSDITSEQGIGETVSHCQTIACHNRCEEEFRFNTPLNFTPFDEELNEIQQCHFNCDIEGGLTYNCEDEFSEFFSSKCCGPEEIIRRPIGGIRKPISPDVRSCLCKNLGNFNVKNALVNPEAIEACKNYCPDGYNYDEINNLCLPICSQGSFRNPDGTCRSNCPRGLIQDEFGSCSCPQGKYLNEFGRCTDGSCPEYCKHTTNFSVPEECKSCIDNSCPPGFQKDPASGICISTSQCGSNMLPNNTPGEASCICPSGLPYWDNTSYQCVASCPNGPPPASSSIGLLPKSPIPCNASGGECPASSPYRCQDGSCTTSYSSCPYSCPPSYPYQCPDGTCVVSNTSCTNCPAANPYKCSDGSCAVSYAGCPYSCPVAYPYKCSDGSCAISASSCLSSCPPSTPYKCSDGTCVVSSTSCTNCPTSTPHKCPDGTCVVTATSCPYPCPASYPYRCSDGTCVTSLSYCPSSCPPSTPYKCSDGTCVVTATSCPYSCPASYPYRCSDGTTCATSAAGCPSSCPAALPYRCQNGTCVISASNCTTTRTCVPGDNPNHPTSPCTCPTGSTQTSTSCLCSAGQAFTSGGCAAGSLTFNSAAISSDGANLAVDFTASASISGTGGAYHFYFSGSDPNTTVAFYSLTTTGNQNIPLSAVINNNVPVKVGDQLKVCLSIDKNFCSAPVTVQAPTCTGGKTFNTSTNKCECPVNQPEGTNGQCQNATLTSATINGNNLTISYTKNFSECALLVKADDNSIILHNGVNSYSLLCSPSGETTVNSLSSFLNITPGYQMKLCKGNGSTGATNTGLWTPNLCSLPISATTSDTITLNSVSLNGDNVTVDFSKNFSDCVGLKDTANLKVSSQNQICANSGQVTFSKSVLVGGYSTSLTAGTQVKLCNNVSGVCSGLVSVTSSESINLNSVSISGNNVTIDFNANSLGGSNCAVLKDVNNTNMHPSLALCFNNGPISYNKDTYFIASFLSGVQVKLCNTTSGYCSGFVTVTGN